MQKIATNTTLPSPPCQQLGTELRLFHPPVSLKAATALSIKILRCQPDSCTLAVLGTGSKLPDAFGVRPNHGRLGTVTSPASHVEPLPEYLGDMGKHVILGGIAHMPGCIYTHIYVVAEDHEGLQKVLDNCLGEPCHQPLQYIGYTQYTLYEVNNRTPLEYHAIQTTNQPGLKPSALFYISSTILAPAFSYPRIKS